MTAMQSLLHELRCEPPAREAGCALRATGRLRAARTWWRAGCLILCLDEAAKPIVWWPTRRSRGYHRSGHLPWHVPLPGDAADSVACFVQDTFELCAIRPACRKRSSVASGQPHLPPAPERPGAGAPRRPKAIASVAVAVVSCWHVAAGRLGSWEIGQLGDWQKLTSGSEAQDTRV